MAADPNDVPSKAGQSQHSNTTSFFGRTNNRVGNSYNASNNNSNQNMTDIFDGAQTSHNQTHRGAPGVSSLSGPQSMAYNNSIDTAMNYTQGQTATSFAMSSTYYPAKTIHPQRSIPKDGHLGGGMGLGSKDNSGSYTLPATSGTKGGGFEKMTLVPSKIGDSGEGRLLSTEKAENVSVLVMNNAESELAENLNEMKLDANINGNTNFNLNSNTNGMDNTETMINDNIELESKGNFLSPTDFYVNNVEDTPLLFNPDWHSSDSPHSILAPDALKVRTVFELDKFVSDKFIDWDYASRYMIIGRIYKLPEDAQFRISIYQSPDDTTQDSTILEVRRNGGDAFLFQEFRSKFLNAMVKAQAIDYEEHPTYTMEQGFLADSDLTELPPLGSDSETDDFITPMSSISNSSLGTNDVFNATSMVKDAIDTTQYRELYRESVVSLRTSCDDENKLDEIIAVDNVVSKLLQPISGQDQIYDTHVIKLLLEVIFKIIQKDASKVSEEDKQSIREINEQWKKLITHPLSEDIAGFFPSQQIQWISWDCIQSFKSIN